MILGIDPGISGALALLRPDGGLVQIADMPIAKVNGRGRVIPQALALWLATQDISHAILEHVATRPGEGAVGAFSFGRGYGTIEGVLAARAIPLTYAAPSKWKSAMGLSDDKGASRRRAMEIWPAHAAMFTRVKDDGRAEAALIGLYGLRQILREAA